jgi:hypothetical protein
VVYESAGSAPAGAREAGERALAEARERWRIPYAVIRADPGDPEAWAADAEQAVGRAIAG